MIGINIKHFPDLDSKFRVEVFFLGEMSLKTNNERRPNVSQTLFIFWLHNRWMIN